jgi:hypothetical protein
MNLAALALADLEEGPLLGGADLVALGVDQEDVGGLAGDLAAQDEGRRPVGARRDQGVAVALCVVARLPADSSAKTRSGAGRSRDGAFQGAQLDIYIVV